MLNDRVLDNSLLPGSVVHLMLDTAGNLLNHKTFTLRNSSLNFEYSPEYFASYKNGDLCLLLRILADSSFQIGEKTLPLPNIKSRYFVLVKTDTSYSNVSYQLLNPLQQVFDDPNGPGFTIHLSDKDSVYMILSAYNNSKDLEYDGLKIPVNNKNVLVVFDPTLKAKRAVGLGTSIIEKNKSSLNFKTINTIGNNLLIMLIKG
jgi:hypothetical protein